jgi:hypothetical protein
MWRVRCSHGSVSRALFKQLSPLYPPRNAPSSKKYQIPIAESDDTPHAVLPRQRLEAFFFAVVGRVPSRGGGPISAPPPPRLCPGLLPRILFGARPRTWIDRRSPLSPCCPPPSLRPPFLRPASSSSSAVRHNPPSSCTRRYGTTPGGWIKPRRFKPPGSQIDQSGDQPRAFRDSRLPRIPFGVSRGFSGLTSLFIPHPSSLA